MRTVSVSFPGMTPIRSVLKSSSKKHLRDLSDDVFRLVYHFFGQLQLDPLEAVDGKWQEFTGYRALTRIPLPRSNSESARQMRVAAVLRLISETACAYIFQPVYLTQDGMEMAEIIYPLGSGEAEWVRSVLLNIDRKEQDICGIQRAEITASKVIELVEFLIKSAADAQKFKNGLCQWCKKAAKLWMGLQQLRPMIEPQLEVQVDGQGLLGWRPFPEPSLKDKHSAGGTQNGTTSKPAEKGRLVLEDIAVEVWPRFLATLDDEHSNVLIPGYVLLNVQTEAASQELKALAASLGRGGGSQRSAHARQRQVRGIIGGANGSTENVSFLG